MPAISRTRLQSFIPYLFKKEHKQFRELSIVFCTDERLLGINMEFLSHGDYTDILTFDLSPTVNGPVSGEIYISVERVRENAVKFKKTFGQELHRVMFHGMLHLCGYQDKILNDKLLMQKKEDEYLQLYFKKQ